MEDNLENIEIPEDILELFAAGAFTGNDKDAIKRYVECFKSHNSSLKHTQYYWADHMVKSGITAYSAQEAKDYIASIW